jgi:UDP-N-acetylglucosamine--N-acetylmuramyl-(pentapeptide) pyrophosphoryl-undecaprenol N-acetylglucosamine transferase
MKILLTSGGSGGHFYPLIAIARKLRTIAEEEKVASLDVVFIGDKPFDEELLKFEQIRFIPIASGKVRRYFSFQNFFDIFKTIRAVLRALRIVYVEFPDVVFGKGGFASFPVLIAARLYGIPIIIHESDAVPGKVNSWASKFSRRIAISFPEAAQYFPETRVAHTGNPIRTQLLGGTVNEALELFKIRGDIPTLLVLGGSQGARRINQTIVTALPKLLEHVQVIHQTGVDLYKETTDEAGIILENSQYKDRYHAFPFLAEDTLRNAARAASVVVSRAGANAIFEIAAWELPSIIIPITASAQDHQRNNAYSYARDGACQVLEESNLTPNVLLFDILNILQNKEKAEAMKHAAQKFSKLDAAETVAREIVLLGLHKTQ